MRKLLHTTLGLSALLATSMAANAADVRTRPAPYAPPPPVYAPPPFSWTGFYLGGNISGAWAHRDVTDTFFLGDFGNGNNNGVFIGGGQVGYNWQVGYAVLGIEADFDGAADNNKHRTVGIVQVTSNNRWITTLAARFGLTNGPWLFYVTGGAQVAPRPAAIRPCSMAQMAGGLASQRSQANAKAIYNGTGFLFQDDL